MAVENVKRIDNPLTVIGIFAVIAEITATITIKIISPELQEKFMWFVIIFPSSLVILFFLTLNFNHRVLYAPGDFKEEKNFLKLWGAKKKGKLKKPGLIKRIFNRDRIVAVDMSEQSFRNFTGNTNGKDSQVDDKVEAKKESYKISDSFKYQLNTDLSAPAFYVLLFIIIKTSAKSERDLINSDYEKLLPISWDRGFKELIEAGMITGDINAFNITELFEKDLKAWVNMNNDVLKNLVSVFNKAYYYSTKGIDEYAIKMNDYYKLIKFE